MIHRCLFVLLLSGAACNLGTPTEAETRQQIAAEFCECLQPSVDLSDRMQELLAANRKEEVVQLAGEAEKKATEAMSCCQSTWHRLATDSTTAGAIQPLLLEHCPNLPSVLQQQLLEDISNW